MSITVKELNTLSAMLEQSGFAGSVELRQAADEIARLTAEVERLKRLAQKPLTADELRLVDKHCDWVAFGHAWNAVIKSRLAALSVTDATATALDRLGWVDGIRKLVDGGTDATAKEAAEPMPPSDVPLGDQKRPVSETLSAFTVLKDAFFPAPDAPAGREEGSMGIAPTNIVEQLTHVAANMEYEGFRVSLTEIDICRRAAVEIENLRKALESSVGYLMNAKIDLETGCTKATAIKTIEGGIKMARNALDHHP